MIRISPFEAQGYASYFYARRLKTTVRHTDNNCPCRQHMKNCRYRGDTLITVEGDFDYEEEVSDEPAPVWA